MTLGRSTRPICQKIGYLFRMTELTRGPAKGPDLGWFVYFGDVRVGHIGLRTGVPVLEPQWGWTCGFYPGCDPGQDDQRNR
jgi:hypothetical protein